MTTPPKPLAWSEEARIALEAAELQFRDYARQHRAKTPPQEDKALTNDLFADRCARALNALAKPYSATEEEVAHAEAAFFAYNQAQWDKNEPADATEAIRAALQSLSTISPPAQAGGGVPDGWVLVPREPTEEMIAASGVSPSFARDIWRAMAASLASRPPTPESDQEAFDRWVAGRVAGLDDEGAFLKMHDTTPESAFLAGRASLNSKEQP